MVYNFVYSSSQKEMKWLFVAMEHFYSDWAPLKITLAAVSLAGGGLVKVEKQERQGEEEEESHLSHPTPQGAKIPM